jgi:tRNA (guanosine-2'-O-)-methyltransferase
VESFNISVAAALILYEAQQQRLRRLGRPGDLAEQQQERLLAEFLLRSVVSACLQCGDRSAVTSC